MKRFCFASLAMTLAAQGLAQDAAATIKAAQYAVGMIRGPQRIDPINTLEYWATGSGYTYHASFSYRTPAMRLDMTRGGQREIQVVNGQFAWNESVPGAGFIKGTTAVPSPGAVNERLQQMWTTPHGVLKAAARASASAKVSQEGGATVITFPLGGMLVGVKDPASVMAKVTLNAKMQPERVETRAGNLVTETTYTDYKDLGEILSDVLFPSHIVRKQNGQVVADLTVTKTDPNNPYLVFPVPENVEKGVRK